MRDHGVGKELATLSVHSSDCLDDKIRIIRGILSQRLSSAYLYEILWLPILLPPLHLETLILHYILIKRMCLMSKRRMLYPIFLSEMQLAENIRIVMADTTASKRDISYTGKDRDIPCAFVLRELSPNGRWPKGGIRISREERTTECIHVGQRKISPECQPRKLLQHPDKSIQLSAQIQGVNVMVSLSSSNEKS